MLTKSYIYFTAVLLSTMILSLAGCGGTSATQNGQGAISAKLVWNSTKTTGKSVASAPVGVSNVRLAISGTGISTISHDFPASGGTGTLNYVPVGSGLTVTASGLDSTGAIIYQGSVGSVTVQNGITTDVGIITMAAVTPATAVFTTEMISGKTFNCTNDNGLSYNLLTFRVDGVLLVDSVQQGTWSINGTGNVVLQTPGGIDTLTFTSTTGTVITAIDAFDSGSAVMTLTATPITGIWRVTNGVAFSYLALFADNTFLYAENDPTAPPGDNGVEVGTYTNDGSTITFNVTYDRNGPGQNSGIGEIGTPMISNYTLANNGNTFTFAGGQLVLNRANFNPTSVVGAWRSVNGAGFSCLILFDDNTVLYAERDPAVVNPAENGLEVGTYTFDGTNLTSNLVYDDNAPVGNSGLGSIGSPTIYGTSLSNNNNTLTTAGGALVLTREF